MCVFSPALVLVSALGSLGLLLALAVYRHQHPINLYLLLTFVRNTLYTHFSETKLCCGAEEQRKQSVQHSLYFQPFINVKSNSLWSPNQIQTHFKCFISMKLNSKDEG